MAIQVGGTTVITNNRVLQNVTGVGGAALEDTGKGFTTHNSLNNITGGTNGKIGILKVFLDSNSGNQSGNSNFTVNGNTAWHSFIGTSLNYNNSNRNVFNITVSTGGNLGDKGLLFVPPGGNVSASASYSSLSGVYIYKNL